MELVEELYEFGKQMDRHDPAREMLGRAYQRLEMLEAEMEAIDAALGLTEDDDRLSIIRQMLKRVAH